MRTVVMPGCRLTMPARAAKKPRGSPSCFSRVWSGQKR